MQGNHSIVLLGLVTRVDFFGEKLNQMELASNLDRGRGCMSDQKERENSRGKGDVEPHFARDKWLATSGRRRYMRASNEGRGETYIFPVEEGTFRPTTADTLYSERTPTEKGVQVNTRTSVRRKAAVSTKRLQTP